MNYFGLTNTTGSVAKHFYPGACFSLPSMVRASHTYQVLGIYQQILQLNNGCTHSSHWKPTSAVKVKLHYISMWLVGISIWYTSLNYMVLTLQRHLLLLHRPTAMTAVQLQISEKVYHLLQATRDIWRMKRGGNQGSVNTTTIIRIRGWHPR